MTHKFYTDTPRVPLASDCRLLRRKPRKPHVSVLVISVADRKALVKRAADGLRAHYLKRWPAAKMLPDSAWRAYARPMLKAIGL